MKRTLCVIALISFARVAEAAGQTAAPPAGEPRRRRASRAPGDGTRAV